jgi:hypothetical protein
MVKTSNCTVKIASFTYEGGTYRKGECFTCDSVRAVKFEPTSITVVTTVEPPVATEKVTVANSVIVPKTVKP